MLLEVRREAKHPLLVGTVILVFLSIFMKNQASSPFEAVKFARHLRCQVNVRHPVQKSWRPRAFSNVSTGDSDIPSSCEMKDEPAFKTVHRNPAFFWVSASRGPFHLRQKTQSPSHIPIGEGRLLLSCLWKVGLSLQSKRGTDSYPETIWVAEKFPEVAVLTLMILNTWNGCLC